MQWLYVFRGTLVAYGFGILLIAAATFIEGGVATGVVGIVAVSGLFVLIPLQIIVFIIWGLLARKGAVVTAWQTAAIGAAMFFGLTTLGTLADGDILASMIVTLASPLIGAIFGAVFWVGAFGFRRDMPIGKRMPEDWW